MVHRTVLLTALAASAALGFAAATGPLGGVTLTAQAGPTGQVAPATADIPKSFSAPKVGYDYEQREVMIPMRDGVRLFTVITVPKGATNAPILLTRTPYNAARRSARSESPRMLARLPQGDEVFVQQGYIRVFQDVRGKDGSEGDYLMTRPLRGPLNPTATDHSTDAYDTIEWLVKHVPESNGRVGMLGSSYEGFTVVMALVNPHPALKVTAPMSPMVDGWMGDDWFHYGAFRQVNLDYFAEQTTGRRAGDAIVRQTMDDYENFRRAGSAGDFARAAGLEQLPWWRKVLEHPAYDAFWQEQALDRIMARQPLTVPTMWIQGLWDQEDMWGAIHAYLAVEPKDSDNRKNFLVMGPWRHSGVNYEGRSLGPLHFEGDTALQFRRDVLLPYFNQYLKAGSPAANTPPVFIYNTGENHWDRLDKWPLGTATPLYLTGGFGLSLDRRGAEAPGNRGSEPRADRGEPRGDRGGEPRGDRGGEPRGDSDAFESDPAKPVPYLSRPVQFADGDRWRTWLLTDQRVVADRPDVLTYQGEPLTAPLRLAGAPVANLVASTTGSDADWVVKLIDVYPDEVPGDPQMSGYQLAIAMDIFRGRYRESFEKPAAIPANTPVPFRFVLPTVNHTLLPGHRLMVQIQSSWFPLYDRNPQTFVPNIFLARPSDYIKATHRVYRGNGDRASFVELPVVR